MVAEKLLSHPQTACIRVLVADSTFMGNQLLAAALSRDRRFLVVGTAEAAEGALAGLRGPVDVAIISGTLAEPCSGIHLSRQLLAVHPGLRIVMLLEHTERGAVIEAFRAGATGVFCRAEPIEALWKCIETVHRGKVWADDEKLKFVLEELASSPGVRVLARGEACSLTEREQKIVRLVAEGMTNREIAAELGLNEHTLKSCLQQLFGKFDVSSRAEMVFAVSAQVRPGPLYPIPPEERVEGPPDEGGPDSEARFEWYARVAERGFALAQLRTGEGWLEGRGTTKDLVTAYACFLMAEESSNRILSTSQAYRESLAARMNDEQVAQAMQKAAEWLQKERKGPSPAGKGSPAERSASAFEGRSLRSKRELSA